MSKIKGQERVMYLFKESPYPVIDCFWEAIKREVKRREVEGIPELRATGQIFVRYEIWHVLRRELISCRRYQELPNGNFYFEKYEVAPFMPSTLSDATRPECSCIMFVTDTYQLTGV